MRYAIISDIHEDIVNLRFALNRIEKLNCNEIVCLGDISGFSAPHYSYYNTRNAGECLKLIRKNCKIIVAGNHDLHAARVTPKINPEFEYPENWYQLDYIERLVGCNEKVWLYENDELSPLYTHEEINFIKTLPELDILDNKVLFTHYCYPNLTGSTRVFYNFIDNFKQHKDFMRDKNCVFSFVGHRHFAGLLIAAKHGMIEYRFGKKYKLLNDDCILVPAITGKRNGNGFCIYDTEQNTVEAFRI